MPLIPAEDKTNEETVANAKATLATKEQVEANLRSRLEAATNAVAALTTEAGDASAAIYIGEASGASKEELDRLRLLAADKIDALDAAKRECDALAHAVTVASGQAADARMAFTRVAFRSQINRVSKLLERLVGETVRLENSIEASVGHYKTILKHLDTLRSSWPGGNLPPISELTNDSLTVAIEQHIYKVGTVIDPTVNTPIIRFPGGRAHDLSLLGLPERLPSISDGLNNARRFLLDVLEGRKDPRSGAVIPSTTETAAATPAA